MSNNDRYFPNTYQDYGDNWTPSNLDNLNNYLKEISLTCVVKNKPKAKDEYCDGGLYTGSAGAIFMSHKIVSNNLLKENVSYFKKYIHDSIQANRDFFSNTPNIWDVSFLCGKAGFLLMGSLGSKLLGLDEDSIKYANEYASLAHICEPINFLKKGSDEMLVGRAGYLCGLLCFKNYLYLEPVPRSEVFKLCSSVIESGRMHSRGVKSPSPLMYAYHDTEYLGAAHGLSGILQILLSFPDYLHLHPDAEKDVKDSVDFMLSIQDSNGNFPSAMDEMDPSIPRENRKGLVHWCHGAGGVIFLMAKAYLYWKDEKYLNSCIKCGELIWRKGLLKKGPGICHGVAGNGYAQLLLYRLTNDTKYLYRAHKFAEFLQTDTFKLQARTPDSPFSLFEGLAGTACFIVDLINPNNAEFPLIPVFN